MCYKAIEKLGHACIVKKLYIQPVYNLGTDTATLKIDLVAPMELLFPNEREKIQ
jgi:hypothetical protein